MTEIGINYEAPLAGLVEQAARSGLVQVIEIIPDSYAHEHTDALRQILDRYRMPYVFHFVDNSLGSADYADNNNLAAYGEMVRKLKPRFTSDHLTCCRAGDIDLRMNLAVPRTEEMKEVFVENIRLTRNRFGRQRKFLVENIGGLWDFPASTIEAARFYREIVERSGAYFLLDVHNLYAQELNERVDAVEFIESLPPERIVEVHVSGGSWTADRSTYLDSHSSRTPGRVFDLLEVVLERAEPDLVVLERVTTKRDPPRVAKEIVADLEIMNDLVRRWKR
jgi:uncharacterized protein (UPF0276 family)